MNIDKRALREVAEKATKGPWEMEQENIWFTDEDGYTKHLAYVEQGDDVDDNHYNTAYIAAANPATMLALLDELDSANGYASAYEAEKWHYHGLAESEGERADRAEKQVEELTMWIKRLAHSLRNAKPDSKLHGAVMDYLSRKGLISVEDVLR
ncbi:ead/Ea22-like family protein [Salmonella enterica]|uniref:ead/Ea22-like family protein n=1 Tax=Salmonella enterica TaxID=28901 RepID=UPI00126C8B61|nr:ead/Ea22-like family protein [Salmonella enterica]ECE8866187.1 ead/Ea22-like family protein [Salmonella enterica subsp. enterica serovar Sundsvall]EDH1767118.1 ead/Ea22-like family protein [Salmonella enterica]EDV1370798.1 ead/Ea22-like family protein [Salmonella enterica subsp. enterica serovar Sundsvall]EGB6132567.1 ead/Ea22-like family protein [Salmonella enterica]